MAEDLGPILRDIHSTLLSILSIQEGLAEDSEDAAASDQRLDAQASLAATIGGGSSGGGGGGGPRPEKRGVVNKLGSQALETLSDPFKSSAVAGFELARRGAMALAGATINAPEVGAATFNAVGAEKRFVHQSAEQRTRSILSRFAAAGGKVTKDQAAGLFELNRAQSQRIADANRQITAGIDKVSTEDLTGDSSAADAELKKIMERSVKVQEEIANNTRQGS